MFFYIEVKCYAIRIIPKYNKEKESRQMHVVHVNYDNSDYITLDLDIKEHAGLFSLLSKLYPEINPYTISANPNTISFDNSDENSLIIREYETINW
jgi:hypothetical protein